MESVHFTDARNGWIAGLNNTSGGSKKYMAYTRDGGGTWTPIQGAPSYKSVYFVNINKGFTAYGRDIIGTVDGGLTWEVVHNEGWGTIIKIFFITSDIGYAFGTVFVLKTVDGGTTWNNCLFASSSSDDYTYRFMDASFIGQRVGWFVWRKYTGYRYLGRIYSTVDGGDSQFKVDTTYVDSKGTVGMLFPGLCSIGFTDESNGYVGGDSGFFAYTNNGGGTWTERSFDKSYGAIRRIIFVNNTAGWILSDKLLFTLNGGATWEEAVAPGNVKTYTDIMFTDANHGWIVGGGNLILRTTDNGGHPQPVSVKPSAWGKRQPASAFSMRPLPNRNGNGRARFAYRLNTDAALSLTVYDLKGARAAFAPKRAQSAGEHEFSFKGAKGFYIVEAKIQSRAGETKFAKRFFVR